MTGLLAFLRHFKGCFNIYYIPDVIFTNSPLCKAMFQIMQNYAKSGGLCWHLKSSFFQLSDWLFQIIKKRRRKSEITWKHGGNERSKLRCVTFPIQRVLAWKNYSRKLHWFRCKLLCWLEHRFSCRTAENTQCEHGLKNPWYFESKKLKFDRIENDDRALSTLKKASSKTVIFASDF